ncbi:hypothetical protein GCM10010503_35940 [Streptomyces lucensis JCM 4490]|uniref:Secreted protein n=1 Tax=Streptomyces lucensis JCM 4490 TaxID=1306176 RepID=A0A918J7D2_9ACTN|nr:hypothetical protein [Streptomyces lucensis]GGW55662.1 hypothetical protein GCM10010503_35940 [Streptomyces lucensis JCM 4490]
MKAVMKSAGILGGLVTAGVLALAQPSAAVSVASDDTYFTTQATKQYTCAKTTCRVKRNLFKGQPLWLNCYYVGQRVSGNSIWYNTTTFEGEYWVDGYTPGQYINTGSDPRPGIARC